MRVLALCGSLQAKSSNLELLHKATGLAPAGMHIELFDGIRSLPHFNPDLEIHAVIPEVDAFRCALTASDALLIAAPEYGHSLPGALKNAIDWVIGSGELEGKIVALTCAAASEDRGRKGLLALQTTLAAVRAQVAFGTPLRSGPTLDTAIAALLRTLEAAIAAARLLEAEPNA
jgi:chromate reductase, NAD(P)H dehydrogenase (quinone)